MRKPFKQIPDFDEAGWVEFWGLVDRRGEDECWPWKGYTNMGYGTFYYKGEAYKAHRVVYTKEVGPIDPGLTIDHVYRRGCRLKTCCNWKHMEPVTQRVNTIRGMEVYWEEKIKDPAKCLHGHDREPGKACRVCAVRAVAATVKANPEKYRPLRSAQKRKERCRWKGIARKCVVCGKDYLTSLRHCGQGTVAREIEQYGKHVAMAKFLKTSVSGV